ncbi:hypothetical protein NY406_01960 [Chlorobaculum sp. MV4-Y]|uniref:hypothetical protein n=1 Tax=Chlorobaculum sp. MV4-Y TaxID=2976335 RepID=UPI0021B06807|nr:hypothetical protein [Chlorobaculum sp. MV4-Y]UWX58061.1 hypothetical protein NY406_01960 [Chlorobaculum sp. MV4-Y]
MKPTYTTWLRRMTVLALLYAFAISPTPALAFDSFEELLDRSGSEGTAEELFNDLEDLRRNKIPVNLATEEQLLELPLLSAADAAKIITRRQRGPIRAIAELEAVIGKDAARRLAPYLSFKLPPEKKRKEPQEKLRGSVIGRVFWEDPPRAGVTNGKYAGGNRHVYSRFQVATPHYGVHLLSDSDVGEPDIDDFLSFNVHAERIGILTQAVVGNYKLSFGQGLLFGQGRYFFKGSDAVDGVLLFAPALRPYTSAGEDNFLQGAAATISPGPFELTAFTSSNKLDATIKNGVVTSIATGGYHRTATELKKKDNLTQEVNGVNLRYRYRAGELSSAIGATWTKYRYGLPLTWLDDGKNGGQLTSLEASAVYRNTQVFGEAAYAAEPGALSWICGVQADLAKGIAGIVSMRDYAFEYYSPFAGAFAERGDNASNESGLYFGLKAKALDNLTLAGFYDRFRFPVLDKRYYVYPSSGYEARFYATWEQNRWITWDVMYQHKEKEEAKKQFDSNIGTSPYIPVPKITNRAQLGLVARCSSSITLKSRAAFKSLRSHFVSGTESEEGWLLYQQLNWKSGPFTLKTRLARFDTDSYDVALYAYEDDLPLVYTLNAYYGRGKAWFIVLDFEPVKNFNLTAKYETTWYDDRDVYSSGNDLRNTSSPASFNVGCMLKF